MLLATSGGAAVIAEKCLRERRVVSSATARAKRKAEGGDLETQRLVIISPMLQGPNVRHTRAHFKPPPTSATFPSSTASPSSTPFIIHSVSSLASP